MGRSAVILFLLLVSCISSASGLAEGADIPNTSRSVVLLRDIYSMQEIDNARVSFSFRQDGREVVIDRMTDSSGRAVVPIEAGGWSLIIRADRLDTPGKDYYGEYDIDMSPEVEVFLFPAGSVRGIVLDKLDNLVSRARLKFDCDMENLEAPPAESDSFGTFSYDYVPAGRCRVSAAYMDAAGYSDITVSAGNVTEAIIRLDKTIVSDAIFSRASYLWLLPVAALVFIIALFAVLKIPAMKKPADKKPLERRTCDILKTLNIREQKVVSFLLENNNESTQNIIRHRTSIPKTTLLRIFDSLKEKGIISVDTDGTLKHIRLTPWFLGKK